jgi:hypothetical protein
MRTPGKEFLLSRRDREGRITLRKIHRVPRVSRSKDITSTISYSYNRIVENSRKGGKKRDIWHLKGYQNSFTPYSTVVR